MFIDRARIKVEGGAGGSGCTSFRREKYVPLGGPNGGDGGHGADAVFVASNRYTSLLDLHYHSTWKGRSGENGQGKDMHGKNAPELIIPVPLGTLVKDFETEEILAELLEEGQRFVAASGGRGGKGNARFATSTNQGPQFSEKGEPGEVREFIVELKLIAELGLVGLPNAGKSTFLAASTAATPKIANYPFTTLSPNLGVAKLSQYRLLTIADIPGIIEGAAQGKGLGHDFLRHIERTRVLLFILDLGDDDPVKTLKILEKELAQHSDVFKKRPKIVALNKIDVPENAEKAKKLKRKFKDCFLISAASGEGVPALMEHVWEVLERVRREDKGEEIAEAPGREYTFEAPYTIERIPQGYRIDGKTVERAVNMTDFSNEEAVDHLQRKLKKMGIFKALKRMRAKEGESILIGTAELEYQPE
jgi:GTP-binding protein